MQIDWASFTPWSAIAGGILIGIAATMLWSIAGRVAGVSGIIAGMLHPRRDDFGWRLAFTVGMLVAPFAFMVFSPLPALQVSASYPVLIAGGLLVGIGTRYGSGCTSGHGVCGVARASPRSIAATLSFMLAGFVTVYVVRHLVG